ncbi:unnamed protein product [Mytilus edulis]|uniref:Myb/SANT-like DNA-binding domain-containing protein n=1 Tax=Mytilus edulis TaxID=6550 RepID=A0A8S3PQ44_MYTED|nr:unnamed protein product [Mytilus edulis]
MAANVSAKTTRERKLNFTAIESNLISELATTHLELLQGKHSPEVTNAKKQEMWQDITSKVNALGVSQDRDRGRPSSLVKKAKEMKGQIEEYLQNYQPLKSLPKVGDSLLNDYVDKTKGISEEERDELTSYLSLKYKDIFNLSVSSDIPSMMHNTISFIIHHSGHKDQLEHTLQSSAVNEEMEDVWRNRLDIHFNAISDSSVPAAAPVTVVHEMVQNRTDLTVRSDEQEPPQKKTKKKTADDVYSLQCQVLERKLIKTNLQIQLYERLHSKLDDNLTAGLLSFMEQ